MRLFMFQAKPSQAGRQGAALSIAPIENGPFGYRRSLDGIRGAAILMVIAFHLGLPWAKWGFVGVDLFFTLSGFLITSIIVDEFQRTGDLSLSRFYLRRAGRLLPALIALCTALLTAAIIARGDTPSMARSVLYSLFYVQNWGLILDRKLHGALSHTWSLSVEEQYYLLWPLALMLILRRARSPKAIGTALLVVCVGVATWRWTLWQGGVGYTRVYNGTDTRADALLAGSALAFLRPVMTKSACRVGAGAGVAAAAAYLFFAPWQEAYGSNHLYCGGLVVIAWGAAGLISEAMAGDSLLCAALSSRGLVALGKLSYSAYLWHYPVVLAIHTTGLRIGAIAVASIASYRYVEKPARDAIRNLTTPIAQPRDLTTSRCRAATATEADRA